MSANRPLARVRIILDQRAPSEILVIAPEDHPSRGQILAWLRDRLGQHVQDIGPISFGNPLMPDICYVLGWHTEGGIERLFGDLAAAMSRELGIVWICSVGRAYPVWLGELQ